jgi:hypothetical protein
MNPFSDGLAAHFSIPKYESEKKAISTGCSNEAGGKPRRLAHRLQREHGRVVTDEHGKSSSAVDGVEFALFVKVWRLPNFVELIYINV